MMILVLLIICTTFVLQGCGGNGGTDTGYNSMITKLSKDGHMAKSSLPRANTMVFKRKWGSQGSADGQFDWPYSTAVSSAGSVYVGSANGMRLQKAEGSSGRPWQRERHSRQGARESGV